VGGWGGVLGKIVRGHECLACLWTCVAVATRAGQEGRREDTLLGEYYCRSGSESTGTRVSTYLATAFVLGSSAAFWSGAA